MAANKKLLLLPGDGIGPEVMDATMRVVGWFGQAQGLAFETEEALVGGARHRQPWPPIPMRPWSRRMPPMPC